MEETKALYILKEIEKYVNGIIRDKNEMDKVGMQAESIKFLVSRLKMELESITADARERYDHNSVWFTAQKKNKKIIL